MKSHFGKETKMCNHNHSESESALKQQNEIPSFLEGV